MQDFQARPYTHCNFRLSTSRISTQATNEKASSYRELSDPITAILAPKEGSGIVGTS